MRWLTSLPPGPGLAHWFLRLGLAAVFLSHGLTRAFADRVTPFGVWLDSIGFPVGIAWAWGVTLFEIVGSVLLLLSFWTRPIAVLFIVQMLFGIALVHWQHGWFVVGHGQNGMEFSVLIIAALVALFALSRQEDGYRS